MRQNSLELVLEMEQRKEQKAAQEFGTAKNQLEMQRRRLAGLTSYRQDYLNQANQKAQGGLGSAAFGQYHAFVGKLDEGIEQQRSQLERIASHVESLRQAWMQRQQRRKAVEMLLEKRIEEANRKRERQEQKTSDEFAMQGFLRRIRGNS
ncbi:MULTISPECIES: flagellar export protein FliJ [Gammaproteobacteria]|uniref:flagellar export protein FliJ n=1 Tax=Gammaproteobacteria TaxID=1236 RepID=UPI000DCFD788|nr:MULTISPECIES: flagellar export protein FliJ [Gammaproteobacteria]RTE85457.1 flagellar export protein FliJ [Aliidiomarina sp. B3213]TCZ89424.1 flagellar export protein FliJ [Lysobacter sp. N42]